MDPKVILSFVSSSIRVVKEVSKLELYRNRTSIKRQKRINKSVAVLIMFEEDIKGCIIFEFDKGLSVKMVDNMLKEVYGKGIESMTNEEFKEMFKDILGEVANQISGNAVTELFNSGVKIHILPPIVLINREGLLVSYKQYVESLLDTVYGSMSISILFDNSLDVESLKSEVKS
ncbi:MAG: chemotaxis protein CheX [Brevinematia bacterium]